MNEKTGVPYLKPSTTPDHKFVKKDIVVEVFINQMNVEVFQHTAITQRMTMSKSEYGTFQSKLIENGFNTI